MGCCLRVSKLLLRWCSKNYKKRLSCSIYLCRGDMEVYRRTQVNSSLLYINIIIVISIQLPANKGPDYAKPYLQFILSWKNSLSNATLCALLLQNLLYLRKIFSVVSLSGHSWQVKHVFIYDYACIWCLTQDVTVYLLIRNYRLQKHIITYKGWKRKKSLYKQRWCSLFPLSRKLYLMNCVAIFKVCS